MNVYIILGQGVKKEDVIKEIKEEGYTHNFVFGKDINFNSVDYQMAIADEVWCFGDCTKEIEYKKAEKRGYDIWQMS